MLHMLNWRGGFPLLALLPLIVAISAHAQPIVKAADSPLAWLELRTATHPDFQKRVALATSAENAALLGSVLPYSVTVTNTGRDTIAAIDIRFEVQTGSGTAIRNLFFHSFGSDSRPLLPAGRTLLFTPSGHANAIVGGSSRAAAAARGAGGSGAGGGLDPDTVHILNAAQEVRVSVDLVISADGRTAGANASRMLEDLTQQQAAYTALRNEGMVRINDASVSDASLVAWLKPFTTQMFINDPATHRPDPYVMTTASVARAWLGLVNSGRRADLSNQLAAGTPERAFPVVSKLNKGGLR